MVHFHPEPVDDCPCFEDAIAVLSVVLGSYLGHWYSISLTTPIPLAPGLKRYSGGKGTLIGALRIVLGEQFLTTKLSEIQVLAFFSLGGYLQRPSCSPSFLLSSVRLPESSNLNYRRGNTILQRRECMSSSDEICCLKV